jgi:hypothetical protein
MGSLRFTASLSLTVALVAASGLGAAAQGDPAAVLGWALDETHYADGESGDQDGKWVRKGVAYSYRFDATDDRLDGQAIWTGHGHRYPTEPMFEVQTNTWEVTNDEGGWSGMSTAVVGNGLGDTEAAILEGSGAYEGLTAYLVMTWTRAGGNFRGAIFPGEMPEVP